MEASLPRLGHLWEDICGYIIRPQRAEYDDAELGPEVFRLSKEDKRQYRREDLTVENMRGMNIKCTWFYPNNNLQCFPMPVVIYLHGNSGCRCDALEILHLLGRGFSLFCYDACGSGKSDGKYVSLGFYERQDLACIVEYIQESRRATAIGLWGRSMGAVTAIMYAARDPAIKCLVLDSPFSQLRRLIFDLVKQHASVMPDSMTQMAVKKIRKQIAKLAQFDIDDLDAVKYGSQCTVPTFIFHGADDDFVNYYHSEMIADNYQGLCFHHVIEGGHNSFRKSDVMNVAIPHLELYLIAKPNDEKTRKAKAAREKEAAEEQKKRKAAREKEEAEEAEAAKSSAGPSATNSPKVKPANAEADDDEDGEPAAIHLGDSLGRAGSLSNLNSSLTTAGRAGSVAGGVDTSEASNANNRASHRLVKTTDAEMGAPSKCRAEDEDTDDDEFDKALEKEAAVALQHLKAMESGSENANPNAAAGAADTSGADNKKAE